MKNPSRKYVELIRATSSKWASWDPPNQIKVGDHGKLDSKTGQFQKEGNIYEDVMTAHIAYHHKPDMGALENNLIISSTGVRCLGQTVGAGCGFPGLAEASINGRWEFGRGRGALLIMSRPRSSYIPPGMLLKHLIDIPALKDSLLVTEVVSCPAYSMYLSSANKEVVDVALVATAPTPSPATATIGATCQWRTQNMSGLFRDACDPNGSYSYTPLYVIKKIGQRGLLRRDSPVPDPEGDDLWVDVQEPWEPLDDDGEEDAFEDVISD